MAKKTFLVIAPLLLLLLFVSTSSDAVPILPRNLKAFNDDQQRVSKDLYAQDHVTVMKFEERRMEIELTDYPGTGANNHHDP